MNIRNTLLYRQLHAHRGLLWGVLVALVVLSPNVSSFDLDVDRPIEDAIRAGDTATAIELLQAAMIEDEREDGNNALLGYIYYQRQSWLQAVEQLSVARDKNKKNLDAAYYLGRALLRLDRVDEADEVLAEGLKRAKKELDQARFNNGMGLVALARGEYSDADTFFRKANLADDTNTEYLINLGDANFKMGVPPLAIQYYEEALAIGGEGSTEAYFHWAEACLDLRDYQCALDKLAIVLQQDSTFAPAWRRAGEIYMKAARSSRSISERTELFKNVVGSYERYFELASVTVDSANVRPFFETGLAYINLNGFEQALENLEKVLAIPFEPRDIYYNIGRAKVYLGDYAGAQASFTQHESWVRNQTTEYSPTFSQAEYAQLRGDAAFYKKPQDLTSAIRFYTQSLESRPEQKRLLNNVAFAYQRQNKPAEAVAYYDKRIALGVDSAECRIYRNAGFAAYKVATGGGDEGVDDFLDDDFGFEAPVEVAADEGAFDPNRDYLTASAEYLEKFLACSPEDEDAVRFVASIYMQQDRCSDAVSWFESWAQLQPENPEPYKTLGIAYLTGQCGTDYSRALRYLKQAYDRHVAAGSSCEDAALLLSIAQAHHLRAAGNTTDKAQVNSDFKNAFEWYGRTLKCDPGNADAQKGRDETQFEFN